jgi:hypothetical protein
MTMLLYVLAWFDVWPRVEVDGHDDAPRVIALHF